MMLAESTKSKRFLKTKEIKKKEYKKNKNKKNLSKKRGKRDKQDGELQEKIH
jgi:hypothetical protein